MMTQHWIDIGIKLHVRQWGMDGTETPVLLVHGLSSNAQTWDGVAGRLAAWGHPVVAVDQRGHGLSDKPDDGYDFETVTADLNALLTQLGWQKPLVAGQSWGGNVVLAFGARYPDRARGLVFVDGGFLDIQARPDATWEQIEQKLKPPPLAGMPLAQISQYMRQAHSDWDEEGIAGTLANFEHLPDGTIRPWLTWARHRQILYALWVQRPQTLYPLVTAPVLITAAQQDKPDPHQQQQVNAADTQLRHATTHWFEQTDHDIHVHRPAQLTALIRQFNNDIL